MRAERNGTIAALVVEYGTSDAVGRVRVQAAPKVVIEGKFSRTCDALTCRDPPATDCHGR